MAKVLIGISGGVDSSVALHLLLEKGYNVEGVHFILKNGCGNPDSAQSVCDFFRVKLHILDFSDIFEEKVFSKFIGGYRSGMTPNLCVFCNKFIKFGAFYDFAKSISADYIATGHYCSTKTVDGRTYLLRPEDDMKDQTYFLNQVDERVLAKTIFPLSGLTKVGVRVIAEKLGLFNAKKKGSSDICMMGDLTFREFISPYIMPETGKIKTLEGETVGGHNGLFNYTLGQRKGLGIGGKSGESGRWFVCGKDVENNVLYVSHGNEKPLYSTVIRLKNCNWIGFEPPQEFAAMVKTRYRGDQQSAKVTVCVNAAVVKFDEEQRAVTQGQYCVFYDDEKCLGGGEIDK